MSLSSRPENSISRIRAIKINGLKRTLTGKEGRKEVTKSLRESLASLGEISEEKLWKEKGHDSTAQIKWKQEDSVA